MSAKAIDFLEQAKAHMRAEPDKAWLYIDYALGELRRVSESHQLTMSELRQMDGLPVWIHWMGFSGRNDHWIIWEKPRLGTMFDLDDPDVKYGYNFVAYYRPPGGETK